MTKKIKFPFVLDVSSWKGVIEWDDVHPCPDLVICQASNGIGAWDDSFSTHWDDLRKRQIKRGAYHVFDPESDSQLQINNYLEVFEQAGGFDEDCIPPILDASSFQQAPKNKHVEKKIKRCLDEMQTYTGLIPIIHINRRYWNFLKDQRGNLPDWANDYLLWTSWYPSDPALYKKPPLNTLPNEWENWALWKYDEVATISGIKGYVSLSTLSEWFASQLGISPENRVSQNSNRKKLKIEATIICSEGAIIRRHSQMNSKMLAFLAKGSILAGESIEFVNSNEAWLQVTKPVSGWCPLVHSGKAYLSINKNI